MRLPIIAAMLLIPAAAIAQTQGGPTISGGFVPAPMSTLGPPGPQPGYGVAPPGMRSDDAGPADSTPFSAWGSGTLRWGGAPQLGMHDQELAAGGLVDSPNVNR